MTPACFFGKQTRRAKLGSYQRNYNPAQWHVLVFSQTRMSFKEAPTIRPTPINQRGDRANGGNDRLGPHDPPVQDNATSATTAASRLTTLPDVPMPQAMPVPQRRPVIQDVHPGAPVTTSTTTSFHVGEIVSFFVNIVALKKCKPRRFPTTSSASGPKQAKVTAATKVGARTSRPAAQQLCHAREAFLWISTNCCIAPNPQRIRLFRQLRVLRDQRARRDQRYCNLCGRRLQPQPRPRKPYMTSQPSMEPATKRQLLKIDQASQGTFAEGVPEGTDRS